MIGASKLEKFLYASVFFVCGFGVTAVLPSEVSAKGKSTVTATKNQTAVNKTEKRQVQIKVPVRKPVRKSGSVAGVPQEWLTFLDNLQREMKAKGISQKTLDRAGVCRSACSRSRYRRLLPWEKP